MMSIKKAHHTLELTTPYLEARAIDQDLLVDIITLLHQSRRCSALSIQSESGTSILYFDQGCVQYAQSHIIHQRLGEILKQKKYITDQQLDDALSLSKQMRLGETLIHKQLINQEQLWEALKQQALLVIQTAILGHSITFSLSQYNVTDIPLQLQINAQALLLEVMRQKDEVELALQAFPSLEQIVYPNLPTPHPKLSVNQAYALYLCNERDSLQQLILKHPLGALTALKLYRELWKKQWITFESLPTHTAPLVTSQDTPDLISAVHDESSTYSHKQTLNSQAPPYTRTTTNVRQHSSADQEAEPQPTTQQQGGSQNNPLWFQQIDTPPLVSLCQNIPHDKTNMKPNK